MPIPAGYCAGIRIMKLTPERLVAFCAALAESCNVGKAAATVGISRWTAYQWRKSIPEFAEAWDDAMKAGLLALEDEAHRRGFEGIDEPVFHHGREVGAVRKYSDTLAIFLLKAHSPEKYRERSNLELTGANGGPVQLSHTERAAKIAAILAAAEKRRSEDVADLI